MQGLKVSWIGEALQYTDSNDPKDSAEARLSHKKVVGALVKVRAGIGSHS